jgi:tRNA-specific 2-thiouridylase
MFSDGIKNSNGRPRVALGMSGGVDSSVSAHLLVEAGYDVTGVYLECWRAPGCRTEEDRKDALSVALSLNIPFQVLDFKQAYKDTVVEYFFHEYEAGRTPNPDVMCNKEIKFGLFYDWAMKNGFDYVATGHYAQVIDGALTTSVDEHKDQTYFLYRLRAEQLEHILFPIGHLTKPEVREEARQRNLLNAEKKDSVGICFIGDINVHEFLKERLGENLGEVIDTKGNVIGEHTGLWFYTVGQRHGFTIFPKTLIKQSDGTMVDKHNIPPFYVIGKKAETNQLVVGFGAEAYQKEFGVQELYWITPEVWSGGNVSAVGNSKGEKLFVRIRHTGQLHPCKLDGKIVQLESKIQGIAEGQSAVFYVPTDHGNYVCVGGGVIATS